jgi:hypothetical protein
MGLIHRNLRAALGSRLGQELTPQVCADIEAEVFGGSCGLPGGPDLDALPDAIKANLLLALESAMPAPIPWRFAREEVLQGRWFLIHESGAAAVICHGQFFDVGVTTIVAMAGDLDGCRVVVPLVEQAAAEQGSSRVAYLGRRGWSRFFPSYREMAVACMKELP